MSLGQTLIAILALVLLTTIAVNINRARIASIANTVDNLVDQEALNYGQSVLELVSSRAQTYSGYNHLEEFNEQRFDRTYDSGRTLYAFVEVEDVPLSETDKPYPHKLITVSVYTDSLEQNIRSQYSASLIPWWRYNLD